MTSVIKCAPALTIAPLPIETWVSLPWWCHCFEMLCHVAFPWTIWGVWERLFLCRLCTTVINVLLHVNLALNIIDKWCFHVLNNCRLCERLGMWRFLCGLTLSSVQYCVTLCVASHAFWPPLLANSSYSWAWLKDIRELPAAME